MTAPRETIFFEILIGFYALIRRYDDADALG